MSDHLFFILVFGCLALSSGIWYLVRGYLRWRLYSRLLSRYSSRSARIASGTVIKKESKSVWENRSATGQGWLEITGITPVEEVYQAWPIAPYNLFVCYDAQRADSLSATVPGYRKEVIIKKLENVSKNRFMNTRPGERVELKELEGKKASGVILEELRWSLSASIEDMILCLVVSLLGGGLCFAANYTNTPGAANGPMIVSVLSLAASIHLQQKECIILEGKLLDGYHDTSKSFFVMEEVADDPIIVAAGSDHPMNGERADGSPEIHEPFIIV